MSEEKKLVPKLRFPDFRGAREWVSEKVDVLVDTVTPPKKLPTSCYAHQGKFPIIDQSQSEVCGWTDDQDALIKNDLPLIVFGDHTCILKFVHQPFAQGADGIKILKSRSKIVASYLYQYLNYRPVVTEEYKRHYSILKEKVVLFPDIKTGEQQKIADCLSSLDELIAVQARKVDALKIHKKGLMQQLFPREGETQPRLRFPEFRDVGAWKEVALGQLMTIKGRIGYRGYTVEDIVEAGEGAISLSPSNISAAGMLSFEKATYISWAKFYESPEIILENNFTVLVKTGSTYGKVAFIRDLPHACTVNPQIVVLKPTSTNPYFLYLLISGEPIQSRIEATVVGGAIPTLSQESISKFVVCVPSEAEQQRIADCLTSLDTLITTATQELETLKTHKKGLMQQLFPSAQAVEA